MQQVPIADGLFGWSSGSAWLLGSRCRECGAQTFPVQSGCPRCASEALDEIELPRSGSIWTWTSQEFLPKSPPYGGPETAETFARYFVGYVELEGALRVETRLVGFEDGPPRIGQAVRLEVVPFRRDEQGTEVMTYAFAPAPAPDLAGPGADA